MKNGNGKKVRAGHTSATELFRGMEVTINFHKGIQVKDYPEFFNCIWIGHGFQGVA